MNMPTKFRRQRRTTVQRIFIPWGVTGATTYHVLLHQRIQEWARLSHRGHLTAPRLHPTCPRDEIQPAQVPSLLCHHGGGGRYGWSLAGDVGTLCGAADPSASGGFATQ